MRSSEEPAPESMDLSDPRLPPTSRGHSLPAVTPLLLFCCYSFYRSKYEFAVVLKQRKKKKKEEEEEEEEDRWLEGTERHYIDAEVLR